jgi:hypothetical protein
MSKNDTENSIMSSIGFMAVPGAVLIVLTTLLSILMGTWFLLGLAVYFLFLMTAILTVIDKIMTKLYGRAAA